MFRKVCVLLLCLVFCLGPAAAVNTNNNDEGVQSDVIDDCKFGLNVTPCKDSKNNDVYKLVVYRKTNDYLHSDTFFEITLHWSDGTTTHESIFLPHRSNEARFVTKSGHGKLIIKGHENDYGIRFPCDVKRDDELDGDIVDEQFYLKLTQDKWGYIKYEFRPREWSKAPDCNVKLHCHIDVHPFMSFFSEPFDFVLGLDKGQKVSTGKVDTHHNMIHGFNHYVYDYGLQFKN